MILIKIRLKKKINLQILIPRNNKLIFLKISHRKFKIMRIISGISIVLIL